MYLVKDQSSSQTSIHGLKSEVRSSFKQLRNNDSVESLPKRSAFSSWNKWPRSERDEQKQCTLLKQDCEPVFLRAPVSRS